MGTKDEVRSFAVGIKYKEAESGLLVGQCIEFPFIIVKGKTVNDLVEKVRTHVNVYFRTFPEEGMKIVNAHEKGPEEKTEELKAGWKQEKAITIPLKK